VANGPRDSMTEDERFRRYLLGELFWELEQHPEVGAAIRLAPPETVEVVSYSGYENLNLRIGSRSYRVRLSWRKDRPPRFEGVDDGTT